MTDLADQAAPRRGMSTPFFLTIVIVGALFADRYLLGGDVPAPGAQPFYLLVGVGLVGFLLWLWVVIAARRRSVRFDGPIETVRSTNGALQPILATILIVVGANLAQSYTIPKWLGVFTDGQAPFESDVEPVFDANDEDQSPALENGDGPLPSAEQLLDAITGAEEAPEPRPDKTGRSQRGTLQ